MTRDELMTAVEMAKAETKEALEIVYNALNNGQKKQLLKHEKVKTLFDRYKVEYEE